MYSFEYIQPIVTKPAAEHSATVDSDPAPFNNVQCLANLSCVTPGCGDRPHEVEAVQLVADALKQPLAAAQQHWHEIRLTFQNGKRPLRITMRP
jgi:hypothetical protein